MAAESRQSVRRKNYPAPPPGALRRLINYFTAPLMLAGHCFLSDLQTLRANAVRIVFPSQLSANGTNAVGIMLSAHFLAMRADTMRVVLSTHLLADRTNTM